MGRFGQIAARLLHLHKIKTTVIDYSPDLLDLVRAFGYKVYYGDATQLSILEPVGIQHAKILLLAMDERESCVRTAELVRKHYPHVKIISRAFDLVHAHELMEVGVKDIERETFSAALAVGERALVELGFHPFEAKRSAKIFAKYDEKVVEKMYHHRAERKEYISVARQSREDLTKLFEQDELSIKVGLADSAWT